MEIKDKRVAGLVETIKAIRYELGCTIDEAMQIMNLSKTEQIVKQAAEEAGSNEEFEKELNGLENKIDEAKKSKRSKLLKSYTLCTATYQTENPNGCTYDQTHLYIPKDAVRLIKRAIGPKFTSVRYNFEDDVKRIELVPGDQRKNKEYKDASRKHLDNWDSAGHWYTDPKTGYRHDSYSLGVGATFDGFTEVTLEVWTDHAEIYCDNIG